jgi:hypothetical protein
VEDSQRILKNVLVVVVSIVFIASAPSIKLLAQTSVDDSIFAAKIKQAKEEHLDRLPIGERVAAMGKLFLGTPYEGGTLNTDSTNEHLVVDLRSFDCVTFYENTLAFARIIKEYANPTLQHFRDELTFLRYRDGKINGFHSRLHYTIDYFYNNGQKGVLHDVTREVGKHYAALDDRKIDFMTTHPAYYDQLTPKGSEYRGMLQIEKEINTRKNFYYIPKSDVAAIESGIRTGDILGITTNVAGLDCSHTGIAIRMPDGRIHFMHASSVKGNVIISEDPLAEYLTHTSVQIGIILMRPIEVDRPAFHED